MFSTSRGIHYIGGYHDYIGGSRLHRGIMTTSGGYREYIEGCLVHQRDIMMHVGDTKSTPGDVQYIGGIPWVQRGIPWVQQGISWVQRGISWVHRGYHDACRGILWCMWGIPRIHQGMFSTLEDTMSTAMISWVHPGDIMMHVGEQVDKILSIFIENPEVPMISPWYAHGIPRMYWTSPDVLMTSPNVLNTHQCTHDIPRCTHGIPRCTHNVPPDVLNTVAVLNILDLLNTHYTGWFWRRSSSKIGSPERATAVVFFGTRSHEKLEIWNFSFC